MYKKNERKKNREEDLRNQRNYFSIFLSLILNNMTSNCIVNPRKQQQKKEKIKIEHQLDCRISLLHCCTSK